MVPADTKSDIAPKLPAPKLGPDAGPAEYLAAAKKSLAANKTGEAQEALEMAETRALDRVTPADEASTPDSSTLVSNIHAALEALGKKDMKGATAAVDNAIAGAPVKPMPAKAKSMKPMHPKMPVKPKPPAPPA